MEQNVTSNKSAHVCDSFCQDLNGNASYCQSDLDIPQCFGGNQSCGSCPSALSCDDYCDVLNSANWTGSYCKFYQDPPVCQWGDQPCNSAVCIPKNLTDNLTSAIISNVTNATTTLAPTTTEVYQALEVNTTVAPTTAAPSISCDDFCKEFLNDVSTYCKSWLGEPVCQGYAQPCDATLCVPAVTPTAAINSTLIVGSLNATDGVNASAAIVGNQTILCDEFCQGLFNDETTYCKSWLTEPVCQGYAQPCDSSLCFSPTVLPVATNVTSEISNTTDSLNVTDVSP